MINVVVRKRIQLFVFVLAAAAAGYLWYAHQPQLLILKRAAEQSVAPCASPLTYSIGSIDPRFGVATSAVVADLAQAQSIWDRAAGKQLLQYEPDGGAITVNLVFDNRQAATDKLKAAGLQINTDQATYDSLKSKYDALYAEISIERSAYQNQESAYRQDVANYNAEVDQWNQRGGAPPSAYQQLQEQKTSLETEFENLKTAENKLNADIDTLNALATVLNQLIVQLNLNVQQYNQAGAAAGEFEEGLYQDAGGLQSISIYEYANRTQLVRVLAHEMGHALGLQHVADPNAIMYKINLGTGLRATPSDIAELDQVCQL